MIYLSNIHLIKKNAEKNCGNIRYLNNPYSLKNIIEVKRSRVKPICPGFESCEEGSWVSSDEESHNRTKRSSSAQLLKLIQCLQKSLLIIKITVLMITELFWIYSNALEFL